MPSLSDAVAVGPCRVVINLLVLPATCIAAEKIVIELKPVCRHPQAICIAYPRMHTQPLRVGFAALKVVVSRLTRRSIMEATVSTTETMVSTAEATVSTTKTIDTTTETIVSEQV